MPRDLTTIGIKKPGRLRSCCSLSYS